MKKFVSIMTVLAMCLSFAVSAFAEIEKITAGYGFHLVDIRNGQDKGNEDYIVYYYSRYCSYSQQMYPIIEEYGEDNNIKVYGVDYQDGKMVVSNIINSTVIEFPVVLVYNGATGEVRGLNKARDEDEVIDFIEECLSTRNPEITITINSNEMIADGKKIMLDVPATIKNGRTMLPLRAIFEALGAQVKWDAISERITAVRGAKKVELFVNKPYLYVNDEMTRMDTNAYIENGRTLVPVRAVSEAFGCDVSWNEKNADGYNKIITEK